MSLENHKKIDRVEVGFRYPARFMMLLECWDGKLSQRIPRPKGTNAKVVNNIWKKN